LQSERGRGGTAVYGKRRRRKTNFNDLDDENQWYNPDDSDHSIRSAVSNTSRGDRIERKFAPPPHDLTDLLRICVDCKSQCQGIRDKIYKLISVTEFRIKEMNFRADYSKTAAQLCIDVVLGYILLLTKLCRANNASDARPTVVSASRLKFSSPLWKTALSNLSGIRRKSNLLLCGDWRLLLLKGI
jgi:hypothetical protein